MAVYFPLRLDGDPGLHLRTPQTYSTPPKMPVQSIKSEAQYKEIVDGSGLTAIQFIAPWDEASKTLAPKFDGYSSSKNFSNVKFYKVDINDHEDIGMASGVKNHTFRFLKDGQVKAEFKGDNYAALERALAGFAKDQA